MDVAQLIKATRTVRRFQEEKTVPGQLWPELLELLAWGGSARNLQPLKYMLVTDVQLRGRIFPLLGWAGYLPQWPGPAPGERPTGYLICLLDTVLAPDTRKEASCESYCDLGIATQNFLLAAAQHDIYGCRIASFAPRKLADILQLAKHLQPLLVLALGYAAEQPVVEPLGPDGVIRYWRDENGVHHVPKRSVADIILGQPNTSS